MKSGPAYLREIGISDRVARLHLSGVLSDVAEIAGVDTALQFAWKFGGRLIYISKTGAPTQLTDVLSQAEFDALTQKRTAGIGASYIYVPHGPFSSRSLSSIRGMKMLEDGATLEGVSNKLGVGRSTVQQWRGLLDSAKP